MLKSSMNVDVCFCNTKSSSFAIRFRAARATAQALDALENAMFCQIIFDMSFISFLRLRSCHIALMTFSENSRLESADSFASMKYALNRIVFSFQVFKYQRTRMLSVNFRSKVHL